MRCSCSCGLILWGCFSLCAQERPVGPPFTKDQILHLVGSTQMLEEDQIVEAVKARGVNFPVNDAFLKALRHAEAGEALIAAIVRAPAPAEREGPLPAPLDVPGRADLLEQARKKAISYAVNLPNFNCLQTTRRQEDLSGKGNWATLDVIQHQVAYDSQNGESYQLNTKGSYETQSGATSKGEFGSLMLGVFGFIAEAKFEWERQSFARGRATEVYGYAVRKVNSQWRIGYQRGASPPAGIPGRGGYNMGPRQPAISAEVVAAYRGHIWVDRSTHETLRITMIAVDMPAGYPIQAAGTLVDYEYADLSGHSFLMPKRALVLMRETGKVKRNQIDFSQYQKFTIDTKISFDPPSQPPQ